MKSFFCLGFTATLATLAIAESTFHRSLHHSKQKRAFLTCQETYGGESITCGSADSHYCYDSTLGETCCPLDNGYCGPGDYCAPVAGYCCHDTESPGVCATRLSFTLPISYDPSSAAPSTALASSISTNSTSVAPEVPTSTVQVALAPNPPSAIVSGGGEVVSTTTEGTWVPEKTAPVNVLNLTTVTTTSTAAGVVTSAPTYLQASAAAMGAKVCFGAVMAVVAFAGLML